MIVGMTAFELVYCIAFASLLSPHSYSRTTPNPEGREKANQSDYCAIERNTEPVVPHGPTALDVKMNAVPYVKCRVFSFSGEWSSPGKVPP